MTVEVTAGGGCAWSAASESSWITVTAGETGRGNGNVRMAVAANTGQARTGRAVVAGRTFTIQQEAAAAPPPPPPACEYSIKPTYYNAGAGPDEVRVDVTTTGGCAWSVSGEPSWVTVAEGRNGSGNGTVRLTIPANAGAPRSATLTIAGHRFELSQAGSCAATLKPTYYNSGRGPDDFEITVTIPAGCQWTASSPVDWAMIRAGARGSGDGVVGVHVNPNNQDARSAVLTIAGQPFMLSQEAR